MQWHAKLTGMSFSCLTLWLRAPADESKVIPGMVLRLFWRNCLDVENQDDIVDKL
jgi:hypothetical protein